MNEFTCEKCQEDYFIGPDWEDECYCMTCYLEMFPAPEWMEETRNERN